MGAIGKVSHVSGELTVEWVISNFLSLSEKDFTHYDSDTFSINGQSWFLRTYPNGEDEKSVKYVSLFLKKTSSTPEIKQDFWLSLKNVNGKKENEKVHSYIFNDSVGAGSPHFISRSKLLERKSELLFADALTVICTLKLPGSLNKTEKPEIILKYKALQDYKELFLKKQDCDVIIKVKEQDFHAHKLILKARLPTLAAALQYETTEKITGIIEIEDFEPSHFSDFLYFLYCGEVENLTVENVFSLFTIADKYIIPDLKSMCMDFIKQNIAIDTFCKTIALALLHSETELIKLCVELFAKNMKKIMVTVEWQSYIVKNPLQCNELMLKALECDNHK